MEHFICFSIIILSFVPLQSLNIVEAKISGFSIDLIHHDSKLSPFYNSSTTPRELSRKAALRSIARANKFLLSNSLDESKLESPLVPNGGGYLTKLSLGSPPFEIYGIADTGSDLIWTQCEPCNDQDCFPQDSAKFDPRKSSSYTALPCDSNQCQALPIRACGSANNECQYSYRYGNDYESGYTNGTLAQETFTFDSSSGQAAAFPNSVLGCGFKNKGTFNRRDTGIIGLGAGSLSLISQLSASKIEPIFSYCLLPLSASSSSKLKFGTDAVSPAGAVSTPLLSGTSDTFYYLNLEAVSVGNRRIPNSDQGASGSSAGNIVIDSGTTLTMLGSTFYNQLEEAVKESIGLTPAGSYDNFNLCYQVNSIESLPETTMVFHFSGADVTLKKANMFVMLDSVACFAFLPTDGVNIYGNVAQVDYQVHYDVTKKQLSFAPADCTRF